MNEVLQQTETTTDNNIYTGRVVGTQTIYTLPPSVSTFHFPIWLLTRCSLESRGFLISFRFLIREHLWSLTYCCNVLSVLIIRERTISNNYNNCLNYSIVTGWPRRRSLLEIVGEFIISVLLASSSIACSLRYTGKGMKKAATDFFGEYKPGMQYTTHQQTGLVSYVWVQWPKLQSTRRREGRKSAKQLPLPSYNNSRWLLDELYISLFRTKTTQSSSSFL